MLVSRIALIILRLAALTTIPAERPIYAAHGHLIKPFRFGLALNSLPDQGTAPKLPEIFLGAVDHGLRFAALFDDKPRIVLTDTPQDLPELCARVLFSWLPHFRPARK